MFLGVDSVDQSIIYRLGAIVATKKELKLSLTSLAAYREYCGFWSAKQFKMNVAKIDI